MGVLVMTAQFFLSLSILIVLHEFGHYLPAKWFKTRVEKFFLFFDVNFALFKKKIGETVYGIGWLPLGGYVKISGMVDESFDREQMASEPKPWEFRSKPAWQRLIIMLGGVTVNFILGFLIFGLILWQYGEEYLPAENAKYGIVVDSLGFDLGLRDGDFILKVGDKDFEEFDPTMLRREIGLNNARTIQVNRGGREVVIDVDPKWTKEIISRKTKDYSLVYAAFPTSVDSVIKGSMAETSGLLKGDKVLSVDGEETPFFQQLVRALQSKKGKKVEIGLLRGRDSLAIFPVVSDEGTIGFAPSPPDFDYITRKYSIAEALPAGVKQGVNFLAIQIKAFGQMFSGKTKASDSLGGFGSIANMFPKVWDWHRFWYLTAVLSLILGFMNLLPIPGLDGGHVMFLLAEVATGRKPSDKFLERATQVGFTLLLALLLYANGLDVWRWLTGQ